MIQVYVVFREGGWKRKREKKNGEVKMCKREKGGVFTE